MVEIERIKTVVLQSAISMMKCVIRETPWQGFILAHISPALVSKVGSSTERLFH